MKKILITFLAFAFALTSCEFDKGFEEMNVNPNAAAQIGVGNKFAKTILDTSGGRYENWRNSLIYNSTLIQHYATTASYWSGDKYFRVDSYATSLWDRYYPSAVKGIEDIIDQLNDEGNSGTEMGMARILRVIIYHRLTDTHGDIPYSEAGKGYIDGTLKPKYDAQQDIYMDMLAELEAAVAQISGNSSLGNSDIIYGGDAAKWKALGNSMMLRLAMRMTKADAASAQAWAVKAINGGIIASNAGNAVIAHTDGPEGINKNGHGEVFDVDSQMRMSATFGAHLAGDPRLSVLFAPGSSNAAGEIIGMPNGRTSDDYVGADGVTYAGVADRHIYAQTHPALRKKDVPMVLLTTAEVHFLIGEAIIRGWVSGDAKTYYDAGVTAAMTMLADFYPDSTPIAQADIDAFLAGPGAYDSSKGWEMLMNEYWKATFLNEYEAYANWRRTGYPTLSPTQHPNSVSGNQIMRRMIYPGGESATNAENYAAAVARQGADTWMTRMWWDK